MKQSLLLTFTVATCIIGVFSCKKDDDLKPVAAYDLSVTPDRNSIPVGQLVVFQDIMQSDTNATVDYEWHVTGPDGEETLKASASSGVMNWTPKAPGEYNMSVLAKAYGYQDYSTGRNITVILGDFGFALWGYSAVDIAINEANAQSSVENSSLTQLMYRRQNGDIYDYEIGVSGLYQGGVLFKEKYANSDAQNYIIDFNRKKDSIKTLYGDPVKDTIIWTNAAFKNYPDKWGQALLNDNMSFTTYWLSDRSKLTLELFKDSNSDILMGAAVLKK